MVLGLLFLFTQGNQILSKSVSMTAAGSHSIAAVQCHATEQLSPANTSFARPCFDPITWPAKRKKQPAAFLLFWRDNSLFWRERGLFWRGGGSREDRGEAAIIYSRAMLPLM